jgi:hypothetical protein
MGAGLLASGGPSLRPISTGQALANAYMGGMQTYNALEQQKRKDMLENLQIQQMLTKTTKDKGMQDFILSRLKGGGALPAEDAVASNAALTQGAKSGSIGPTVQNGARMDAFLPASQRLPSGGPSGGFPFTLNEVAMLHALGGPDLTNAYKVATDPIKYEGGSVYQSRMDGSTRYIPKLDNGFTLNADGSTSVVPGYIAGNNAIKAGEAAAQEAVKANYDLLPLGYVGQDGRPIGGTRAGYISSLNQPSPPPSPMSPNPTMTPASYQPTGREGLDLTRLTPQQQAFLRQQNPEAFARGVARFNGGAPVLQSEAEKTQQIGEVTGRQGTQNELNKNWITASYNPILEAGRSANSLMANLDALKNINIETGWGADAKANAAATLTSLGIAPANAQLFATNAQKFQSVAMDRLLTTLQAQKGPQTEGDSTRAQQTFAQLKNTPEANQFISDFARAKANMDIRRAQFYQEALPLAQQAGDLNEVDRRWNKIQGSIWNDPVLQRWKGK